MPDEHNDRCDAAPDGAPRRTRRAFVQSALAAAAVEEARPQPVQLTVNGKDYQLMMEPRVTLLDALRETMGLTGTRKGCDRGQCGACTVLLDGRRVNACLTLAVMAEGRKVITIEGLALGGQLTSMQAAFIEYDAFQHGCCTPGQICSAAVWTIMQERDVKNGCLS